MKQYIVNRRQRSENLVTFGKGSSEGVPQPGTFLVNGRTSLVVVANVVATYAGEPALFIVCDPYTPPTETPATVEHGRDAVHLVRELVALSNPQDD
jgi:hypothetical protein